MNTNTKCAYNCQGHYDFTSGKLSYCDDSPKATVQGFRDADFEERHDF